MTEMTGSLAVPRAYACAYALNLPASSSPPVAIFRAHHRAMALGRDPSVSGGCSFQRGTTEAEQGPRGQQPVTIGYTLVLRRDVTRECVTSGLVQGRCC